MPARSSLRVLAAATALAAGIGLAPAASAETLVVDDSGDATGSLTDISRVRVVHATNNVFVKTTFPDLQKEADAGLTVYVDTRPRRRGPEFGIGLPLFSGGDYALHRMRKWKFVGEPVDCDYGGKFAWAKDYVRLRFDRECFGEPNRVRVGMVMRDNADASHPITDWLIDRRAWTDWVAHD